MKCKNKLVIVRGMRIKTDIHNISFSCLVTNDEKGKTLSITDGNVQFTIPFEPLEKYLK